MHDNMMLVTKIYILVVSLTYFTSGGVKLRGKVIAMQSVVASKITSGTVTDSGSEYTGFIGVISRYIYKAGKL